MRRREDVAAGGVLPFFMKRIAGTFFALLFLVWGLLTTVGGAGEGRADWIVLGLVLAGFGCLFLPSLKVVWRGD